MIGERQAQNEASASRSDKIWLRVEAVWDAHPQQHTQSLIHSIPRCVAAVIDRYAGKTFYRFSRLPHFK